ncbi:MAG: 3-methyl-2-oxobutanoate hydroxymethyltransferase, partial [Planctomycetota bacterium]
MVEPLAAQITREVPIPTIGIGASPACDGQILVTQDMLGLFDWTPKFVKRYGALKQSIKEAVAGYASEVRDRSFPAPAQVYQLSGAAKKAP